MQHRQDTVAERLMRARISAPIRPANEAARLLLRSQPGRAEKEKPDWRVLAWLQKYYRTRDNHAAEFEVTETLFRTQPFLKHYQELRDLARQLGRWETLRPELLAFLEQAHNTALLIQIALDEDDIDRALETAEEPQRRTAMATPTRMATATTDTATSPLRSPGQPKRRDRMRQ